MNKDRRFRAGSGEFLEGATQGALSLGWLLLAAPFAFMLVDVGQALGLIVRELSAASNGAALVSQRSQVLFAWGVNSLVVCAVTVVCSLALAAPLGFLLAKTDAPGKRLCFAALLLSACTPLYATATGWINLIGLPFLTESELRQLLAAGLIMGVAFSPLCALLAAAGFASVPRELEDAACLHASDLKVFLRVTLPLSAWGVGGAALLAATLALGEITVTDALWTRTYAEQVYQSFQLDWEPGKAGATALPLALAFMATAAALSPVCRRLADIPLEKLACEARTFKLGKYRAAAVMGLLAVGAVYAYPLVDLAYGAIFSADAPPLEILARLSRYAPMSAGSVALAAAAALAAVILATPCAWILCRCKSGNVRLFIWAGLLALLATPGPMIGMSLIKFWNSPFWHNLALGVPELVYDSPLIIILLYASRTVALAVVILWAAMKNIPEDFYSLARAEGASSFEQITRVALPLSRRALLGAWLACYVVSFAEVGGAVTISPPGVALFSICFANQIHYSTCYPELGQMMLLPLALAALPAAAAYAVFTRRGK
jgi:iron(III) transport system permease protein